ncbi:MAG: cobalamin biosynthesis protein CbiG [Planctomycetota bacterium]|nr:MAG: cobalamin biosynthesis protein CbiG [Planctomycetota bacterium]
MPDLVTLSERGLRVARYLAERMAGCTVYVHRSVEDHEAAVRFSRTADLLAERFDRTDGIVFIGPCGVAVRTLAPLVQSKLRDPPVVVVDVGGRYVISLLGGHEAGANRLTILVADILGAEPVITTTTEASKTLIVGIGCRRGVAAETILEILDDGLTQAGRRREEIRFLATADIKADEPGIRIVAERIGTPLRIISSNAIRECRRAVSVSKTAVEKVGLPAVAEPTALLAGRRTKLLIPVIKKQGVALAIAEESCSW